MLASYLQRWSIETIFEESKGEVGMDHYEMRSCSWLPWLIISWSV
jgi:SRSO17 transposase